MQNGLTLKATGNVTPCRFVKLVSGNGDYAGAQCVADDRAIGISRPDTRSSTYPGLDDGFHAIAGEPIAISTPGTVGLLESGAAIAVGAILEPDANGRGITSVSGWSSAIALQSAAAAGELIQVLIWPSYGVAP